MRLCFWKAKYTLRVLKDAGGQWYVQARAGNGEILFNTESYTRESDALRSAEQIAAARYTVLKDKPTKFPL